MDIETIVGAIVAKMANRIVALMPVSVDRVYLTRPINRYLNDHDFRQLIREGLIATKDDLPDFLNNGFINNPVTQYHLAGYIVDGDDADARRLACLYAERYPAAGNAGTVQRYLEYYLNQLRETLATTNYGSVLSARNPFAVISALETLGFRRFVQTSATVTSDRPIPRTEEPKNEVTFSAYYPREVQIDARYGLFVYAHRQTLGDVVRKDVKKFQSELGDEAAESKMSEDTLELREGTSITITPKCKVLTFDPSSLTKIWRGDWTRYEFNFRSGVVPVDERLLIQIFVRVGIIEIAHHIDCTVQVVSPQTESIEPKNPLAAAQLQMQQTTMHEKIFVSYSRLDKKLALNYRLAHIARGSEVFMDTYSIRAGENWRAALARAITEADVFQLFWSKNSAKSRNVRDEWEYAMHYRCPETKCVDFILPVYWTEPLPKPPDELGHLNFMFVPWEQPTES